MYRPPENTNRVKAIKSKFETNSDNTKILSKAPLRKSKTLQDFNIKPNINSDVRAPHKKVIDEFCANSNNNNNNKVNTPASQLNLSRQLSDPSKRNIKRTPAFRADKTSDQKNARLLQNRSRYLDGKISKFDNAIQEGSNENINFKERLSRTKVNGFPPAKSNFSDIRSKFNGQTTTTSPANKSSTNLNSDKSAHNNVNISSETKTDNANNIKTNTLKFLYAEPLPKSQRSKQEDVLYENSDTSSDHDLVIENVHNSSTLKLSESPIKHVKSDYEHVSDNESLYATKNFTRNNLTYGSLRSKKSLEDLSKVTVLTDTLKNALRKPLPPGPAPKKPPRTFLHSPQKTELSLKNESVVEVAPLNLDKKFTKKLNTELQKNVVTPVKKSKGDAKYMLDKLETALKNKGILTRKSAKTGNTSEEDSDNEKNKIKFLNLRDLPTIPSTTSSQTQSVYYTTPESSPKFKLNCLSTTLGCTTSPYEAVKEANSSFFVTSKEEPVYAEPFEYHVDVQKRVKNSQDKDSAIDGDDGTSSTKTIRRSLHYMSSPVPDVKTGEINNHVSEVKNQDQGMNTSESTPPSSACTSDMDSIVSTPSEENKSLIPGIKVKDLIKAIESGNCNKNSKTIYKTNSSPSAINESINNHSVTDDDRVKKLETQLKNTLDRSFSANTFNPISAAQSESNVSEADVNEEDSESKHEAKFETYVKRVRSKIFCRSRKKKEHLFHCCLLVALNRSTPYVKSKFPESVQEPHKIADLCFPEVENGEMDCSIEAQCYSLIITNEMGERTFGYCRRVLPEASTACLPLAYCILSKHRAPGFYRRVLEELEFRHGFPDKFRNAFLEELYNCKFPLPGETIIINCAKIITSAGCDKPRFNRKVPSENVGEEISDYSTNESGRGTLMTKCCDIKDSTENINGANVKMKICKDSETNAEENELDLHSYVIVCNSGEYGTLMRGKNKNNMNIVRGSSAVINVVPVPQVITPSHLKRCSSYPNLPADLESLPSELVLVRPQDSRHEENDLKLLGETLKMPVLQQIFCSLLLERKIILVSCMLSKLSSCIEALQIILYPFSWQHTIIPVLPRSLWEIVDTPTPLVCGVLSDEFVNDYKIENAVVVDLDKGIVLLQVGDEDTILPYCLIQTLKDGLSLASKVTSNKIGAHNVFLSDAFLRVFIQSCGNYRDYIIDGKFKKSDFIQNSKQKGKRIRQFLKWFTETTMFYNFIDAALSSSTNLDLFDQRIKIYSSDSATEILNKMKYWTSYKGFVSTHLNRFQ